MHNTFHKSFSASRTFGDRRMRIMIVVLSICLVTGCAGLAVGTYGTFEFHQDKFNLSDQRLQQNHGENKVYTKEQVISLWGNPDKISATGSCEVFTYQNGYTWSGVGAFVLIVPIPLVIPSGHNETKIYFINNQSVKLTSEYGEVSRMFGYMCGSNECRFESGIVNQDKKRAVAVTWCE